MLQQHTSQYTLPEKPTEMHWEHYTNTVPSLNAEKILPMRSVENYKNFKSHSKEQVSMNLHLCHTKTAAFTRGIISNVAAINTISNSNVFGYNTVGLPC